MLFESSYPPLLQGVSQQHQDLRKPGQVTEQVNMLSDPVTGIRRRPGMKFVKADRAGGAPWELRTLYSEVIELGGARYVMWVDTGSGALQLLDPTDHRVVHEFHNNYLKSTTQRIRTAFVGDTMYIMNLNVLPTITRGNNGMRPLGEAAFAYVASGAYGKTFTLTCFGPNGAGRIVSYTTPNGQGVDDAASSTPEAIALALATELNKSAAAVGGIGVARAGAYIAVWTGRGGAKVSLTSDTGSGHIVTSGSGRVASTSQLPAILPAEVDGLVVAVGSSNTPAYYRYTHSTYSWVECGIPGSVEYIEKTPLKLYKDPLTEEIKLEQERWEGRYAGDDKSNPEFAWMSRTVTGMCSYQGRLCIMAGNVVAFSAAGNPARWFRSTVTELVDSDPIEIGASAQSSASYTWGVQYQRDLVLFSQQHQAVVPSGASAITPRTATVVPTSAYGVDTNCIPKSLGKTLMYGRPVSSGFTGFMEMVPSQYTDSQYISDDSTPHLPRYFSGYLSYFDSSKSVNMAVAGCTEFPNEMFVYQYTWDGDERAQAAWHKWVFAYPVETAYFIDSVLAVVFRVGRTRVVTTTNPSGSTETARNTQPYLDLYFESASGGATIAQTVKPLATLDNDYARKLAAVRSSTSSKHWGTGMPLRVDLTTDPAAGTEPVFVGMLYDSYVTLPRPVVHDDNGDVVKCKTCTTLKYTLHMQRVYQVHVRCFDGSPGDSPAKVKFARLCTGVGFERYQFQLDKSWIMTEADVVIPVRAVTQSHYITLTAYSVYDMNITGIDYALQYSPIIQRR